MRFYTKEWYALMQRQFYTSGLRRIPDKIYSDKEIQNFYDSDLAEQIETDRKIYNTPPSYTWSQTLLQPGRFDPNDWLFINEETGEMFHPETPEIAKAYLDEEQREAENRFANRPPFDPAETIQCFKDSYRAQLRHITAGYPQWVGETVDKRLLALMRIPNRAYERLKQEEDANKHAFQKIEQEARAVLSEQTIPEEIQSQFHFHDSDVLSFKKEHSDYALTMRICDGWPHNTGTPYCKVIFKQVTQIDREQGLMLRRKADSNGEYRSNCQFLYHELYRTKDGYEVHMLLWTRTALRYLTISCKDISFENNLQLSL